MPNVVPVSRPSLDISERDASRYSISRAILGACDKKLDGLERELSDEVGRRNGKKTDGFWLPNEILSRNLLAGTPTLGGHLVATDLAAGQFIEVLRNRCFVTKLGARMLDGLVGNVTIPGQHGAATAYWVTEVQATTQSDPDFQQITLTPRACTGWVCWSKQALIQTTPSIDMLVRDDLMNVLAIAIDKAALHSVTGAPTPIVATTGIATVAAGTNGAALTFANMVSMEAAVAAGNADLGALAYLTNPGVRGALKTTPKSTAAVGAGFVWERGADGVDRVNGYTAMATNQVASNLTKGTATTICSAVFFGNWNDLVLGSWNGTEILVDPYTLASTRQVNVYATSYVDWGIRHPASFAVCLDALTS